MGTVGTDLSGRLIGEYQVIRRIGLGGMGVVYQGVQPLIGKRVAIKTLLPEVSSDAEAVGRFLTEARAVNSIRHRGIVDIFSFGQLDDGTQYLVMEFLEGRDFARVIAQSAPVPAATVVGWLLEIVDALAAAHNAGVVHRDLKPSNLFLVEHGATSYVKVLDFGAAKLGVPEEGRMQTHASVVIGTPEYIAPEQAQAAAVSPKTDGYALGCVAFELLTGRLPFAAENPVQSMYLHVTGKVPRVSDHVPDLPPALVELIYELMAKRPDQRPDLAQVARRLKQIDTRPKAPERTATQRDVPSPFEEVEHTTPGNYERTYIGEEPGPASQPLPQLPPSVPLPPQTLSGPLAQPVSDPALAKAPSTVSVPSTITTRTPSRSAPLLAVVALFGSALAAGAWFFARGSASDPATRDGMVRAADPTDERSPHRADTAPKDGRSAKPAPDGEGPLAAPTRHHDTPRPADDPPPESSSRVAASTPPAERKARPRPVSSKPVPADRASGLSSRLLALEKQLDSQVAHGAPLDLELAQVRGYRARLANDTSQTMLDAIETATARLEKVARP